MNEVYTRKCEIDMKVLQYYKAPSSVDIDTNKFQEYYQLDANVSGSSSDHACADESGNEENACSVPPKRFIKCRVKGTKIVAHVLITRSIITTLGGVPSGHLDSKRCSMDGTEENSDDDYDFDA